MSFWWDSGQVSVGAGMTMRGSGWVGVEAGLMKDTYPALYFITGAVVEQRTCEGTVGHTCHCDAVYCEQRDADDVRVLLDVGLCPNQTARITHSHEAFKPAV
jgi:hypothetical protein